jgi:alpha-ribazole phosphatase/probable phosphoglycerate mutase
MTNTVIITYFVHGTTTDNEQGRATGWNHGKLSELGERQNISLKEQIKNEEYDVVFCSDLKRAFESAKQVFGDRGIQIIQDKRLRECNYGDLNGADKSALSTYDPVKIKFPNGESYKDVEKRIRSFLKDLLVKFPDKHVAIVAHKAPQLALDVVINGKTWEQAIAEDWRKKVPPEWRPGWMYILKG